MNPDLPPPNRAIGWYRFMLWMMPTCIALTTAIGFVWFELYTYGADSEPLVFGWLILSALATVRIGIFEAKLRNQAEPSDLPEFRSRVFLFFLLQLLIIPALSFALLFAACLVDSF